MRNQNYWKVKLIFFFDCQAFNAINSLECVFFSLPYDLSAEAVKCALRLRNHPSRQSYRQMHDWQAITDEEYGHCTHTTHPLAPHLYETHVSEGKGWYCLNDQQKCLSRNSRNSRNFKKIPEKNFEKKSRTPYFFPLRMSLFVST